MAGASGGGVVGLVCGGFCCGGRRGCAVPKSLKLVCGVVCGVCGGGHVGGGCGGGGWGCSVVVCCRAWLCGCGGCVSPLCVCLCGCVCGVWAWWLIA